MKRSHPFPQTHNQLIDNQSDDKDNEPQHKRQRLTERINNRMNRTNIYMYNIPKLTTYNMRKNKDILNPDINPLINIHKIPAVNNIIESLRLYSKIDKFCIGKESRTSKKIYITSQSSTAGLCSKHIDYGINTKNRNYQLPTLSFCVMNYKCHCSTNYKNININNGINKKFIINQQQKEYISNSNFPSTLISIHVNHEIIGYFFVKKAASSNLKRMAQPTTFPQFRMSLSQKIKLKTSKYKNFEIIINSITNNKEYGIGIGYYFNARNNNNILDLICCFTNISDTQFTISTDENTSTKIHSIQCLMHTEQSVNPVTLFVYNHTQPHQHIKHINNNNNRNINKNNLVIPITIQTQTQAITPIRTTPITYHPLMISIPNTQTQCIPIKYIQNLPQMVSINQPNNSSNLLYLNSSNFHNIQQQMQQPITQNIQLNGLINLIINNNILNT